MISVVIPLYNKEEYIVQTVRSVLDQSYSDFEVIVVDDGSTDKSLEIIKGFNDSRLKIIEQENSGVSVARNRGIQSAKFNWIGFLDADDWWSVDFLKEISEAIISHPKNRIFASGRTLIFPDGQRRYHHEYLPAEGDTGVINYFKVISKYLPLVNSSNSVISKPLIMERGGFKAGQRQHEDHDLWLRLATDNEVVFVNKPLSFYRKDTTASASQSGYNPKDFNTYLDTLHDVESDLTGQELSYFCQYLNSFVFLSYLKNYWNYSKNERNAILQKSKALISGKRASMLSITRILPFNIYPILKLFR